MSTKTSFKRIALVAASALALGGFSVISAPQASATSATFKTTVAYDKDNSYQVVGGQMTLDIGFDSTSVATLTSTGVGTIVSAKDAEIIATETLTSVTSTGFQFNSTTDGGTKGPYDTITVVLTSAVAGTQTLSIVELDPTTGVPGTAVTKTITWTASGTTAAASWKAYLVDTTTGITTPAGRSDSTVPLTYDRSLTSGGASEPKAQIVALLLDGNGNPVNAATVSVTISGPGLINALSSTDGISAGHATPGARVASVSTGTGGYVQVLLGSDGSAGVSTVTLTAGTVSVSRSVTFTGTAATYTLSSVTGTYGVGVFGTDDSGTSKTVYGGIKVTATDSAGGRASSGSFWATSSDKTVATVSAAAHLLNGSANASYNTPGIGAIAVTGLKAGKSTITIRNTDPAGTTAPTVSATIEIEVTSSTADSLTMALDKSTYSPGEPGVLSVTLTNAAGRPVADGTYTIFAAATPLAVNLFMQSNSTGANGAFASGVSVTTVGGVAAFDIYAPSVSGELKFSGTTLSATTVSSALTQNARSKVLAATADVSGGAADANAALALDAANAATDAANNAYDEAQNATQAASDALAAVTALAAQVKSLTAMVLRIGIAVAKLKK